MSVSPAGARPPSLRALSVPRHSLRKEIAMNPIMTMTEADWDEYYIDNELSIMDLLDLYDYVGM